MALNIQRNILFASANQLEFGGSSEYIAGVLPVNVLRKNSGHHAVV
jgi:hypothetical protein